MKKLIQELTLISNHVPIVEDTRKYWFIRTQGGRLYEEFYSEGFVKIIHNKINPRLVRQIIHKEGIDSPKLLDVVKQAYPNERRPGYLLNQVISFLQEVKPGDVVLIPSFNSSLIAFGIVTGELITERLSGDVVTFEMTKRVEWKKVIARSALDPTLYKVMFSHHTILNISEKAHFIDRNLNKLFIKNGRMHLILDVKTPREISARELFGFGNDILDLGDEFLREFEDNQDLSDATTKLNLNSPGYIEIVSGVVIAMVFIAYLGVVLSGGHGKIKFGGNEFEFKANSLLKAITGFLNARTDRINKTRLIEAHLEKLEVEASEEVKKLFSNSDKSESDESHNS